MFGHAPEFWWRPAPTWKALALKPAGLVYGAIAGRRMARSGVAVTVPVLCIGNFTAGGAGKTPTALALAAILRARGHAPAFLSRGYGRTASDAVVVTVDPARHGHADVGDEPLLLSRAAPTFVAADRVRGAGAAVAAGASILIMDDGMQNPALAKTASIAVVDGAMGIGNGLCIPAGPLRAPMEPQWRTLSLLCVIGPGVAGERLAVEARRQGVPTVLARLTPEESAVKALRGHRLYAFTGIGRPTKFFETLAACGLDVVGRRAFGDHHAFDASERRRLAKDAHAAGAALVTTEKDFVRLPRDFASHVLPVRLVFTHGEGTLDALLDRTVGRPLSRS